MTSQPDEQRLTKTLLNISRIKDNPTMKFDQFIEYPKRIFFFKSYAENEEGTLVPDHFLFFKKALYKVKASGL